MIEYGLNGLHNQSVFFGASENGYYTRRIWQITGFCGYFQTNLCLWGEPTRSIKRNVAIFISSSPPKRWNVIPYPFNWHVLSYLVGDHHRVVRINVRALCRSWLFWCFKPPTSTLGDHG